MPAGIGAWPAFWMLGTNVFVTLFILLLMFLLFVDVPSLTNASLHAIGVNRLEMVFFKFFL